MSTVDIVSIVRDAALSVIFASLFWMEHVDRKAAEKRERDILRDKAGIPPEE